MSAPELFDYVIQPAMLVCLQVIVVVDVGNRTRNIVIQPTVYRATEAIMHIPDSCGRTRVFRSIQLSECVADEFLFLPAVESIFCLVVSKQLLGSFECCSNVRFRSIATVEVIHCLAATSSDKELVARMQLHIEVPGIGF